MEKSFRLLMEYHSFLLVDDGMCKVVKFVKDVSVSLWSIIHSYTTDRDSRIRFYKYLVSVSLWSIIHSYILDDCMGDSRILFFGFRLLMEYHSFLLRFF